MPHVYHMKYHLYFHEDLDGAASGAVMLNFLRGRGEDIASYNPLEYNVKLGRKWIRYAFKKPFILVDFRYHPKADWWFDHHDTSFDKPADKNWKKSYKNDKTHLSNPLFKSCCSMIVYHLKKNYSYRPPKYILELAKEVDFVDAADFKNPKEAVSCRKSILKLTALMDNTGYMVQGANLVKALADYKISEIISRPSLKKKIAKYIKDTNITLKAVRDNSKLYGDLAAVVDASNIKGSVFHMLVYAVYPKPKYSIIIKKVDVGYKLGVGVNRWVKKMGQADISKLMSKYGGGGHKTVGGLERSSKKEIMQIVEEIIEYLNKNG
ncbi:MAG TPA: hypothetical protein VJH71_03065 [Candidatus Paceibacterota bacterium]